MPFWSFWPKINVFFGACCPFKISMQRQISVSNAWGRRRPPPLSIRPLSLFIVVNNSTKYHRVENSYKISSNSLMWSIENWFQKSPAKQFTHTLRKGTMKCLPATARGVKGGPTCVSGMGAGGEGGSPDGKMSYGIDTVDGPSVNLQHIM